MVKRFALRGTVLSTLMVAAAYASAFLPGGAPEWAAWALALGTAGVLVSVMMLGAERNGRVGRLKWAFALVFLIVGGGFALLLAMPPADPQDPTLFLGLPPRAAVLLFGIGILPLFVVPVAYAMTFEEMTLSESDLERVRAMGRSRAAMEAPRAGGEIERGGGPRDAEVVVHAARDGEDAR